MKNKKLTFIIAVGLMAALCFVGNYIQIKIPNGVLITRVHLGNSMCLLAGILFGGLGGGLASGIGAALYDLLDPAYIISSPFTFLSKFAMGYICGELASRFKTREKNSKNVAGIVVSAAAGQIAYIDLYLLKTYLGQILLGAAHETALTATATNAITSSVNAVLAIVISVPLFYALKVPLSSTYFADLIYDKPKMTKWYVWVIAIILFLAVSVGAIYFYSMNK